MKENINHPCLPSKGKLCSPFSHTTLRTNLKRILWAWSGEFGPKTYHTALVLHMGLAETHDVSWPICCCEVVLGWHKGVWPMDRPTCTWLGACCRLASVYANLWDMMGKESFCSGRVSHYQTTSCDGIWEGYGFVCPCRCRAGVVPKSFTTNHGHTVPSLPQLLSWIISTDHGSTGYMNGWKDVFGASTEAVWHC